MAKKVVEENTVAENVATNDGVVSKTLTQNEVIGETLPELTEENKDVEKVAEFSTAEINLTQDELNEINRKAYEQNMERYRVDYERMVDSAQTSFLFQTDEQILALVEEEKKSKLFFPKLIDAYLAELKRRNVDVTELQAYFDSVEYTKPWMSL